MLNSDRRVALPLSVVLILITQLSLGSDGPVDVRRFPVTPGDTLLIQIDYGRVIVHSRASPELEVHLTKRANTAEQLQNIEIAGQKQGNKIYLNAYFYSYQGESLLADIWAPPELNVVVWGANPDVQINDRSGYVRVHSLTGTITADDLTASASLMTDSGNIVYRARKQPGHDVRIETVTGSVLCELKEDLNFRGWARAGGKLKWNSEIEMNEGSLERQIGLGGPLCYAASLKGQVEFKLSRELAGPSSPPPPPVIQDNNPDSRDGSEPPASDAPITVQGQTPDQPPVPSQGPVTQDASGTYSSGYKVKLDVDWIYLNASVRERRTNRSVPNLQKTDFQVYEDGVPQTIGKFLETQEPFHLMLLIDVSGSTQEYLDLIKDASIEFTREIGPQDQIAIATFNSNYRLRQDFTGDRGRAINTIQSIRSGGGTAVYDALLEAVNHMRRIEGRKAIVLFSDGVDNQLQGNSGEGSRATFDQLYREIQEADALVYTIFLNTEDSAAVPGRSGGSVIDILGDILRGPGGRIPGRQPRRRPVYNDRSYEEARQQMEMIADQTGARMYAPDRIQDLSHAYSEIADDLRVQYTLGYNSTNGAKDGAWRKVKVSIANRSDLVVRTRKGYYSQAATSGGNKLASQTQ